MSRMLAAKSSLATRVDALGEDTNFDLGEQHRVKLEMRLRVLEAGNQRRISGTGKAKAKFEKYHTTSEYMQYPAAADSTLPANKRRHSQIDEKKPLIEEINEAAGENEEVPRKKKKKQADEANESIVKDETIEESEQKVEIPKKKKKKIKQEVDKQEEEQANAVAEVQEQGKKKKKKRIQEDLQVDSLPVEEVAETTVSEKKKKKKKKLESTDE